MKAAKFILMWLFLGWWAVPMLLIGIVLSAILDGGWTGSGDDIFWHVDEDLDSVSDWCCEKLSLFFK